MLSPQVNLARLFLPLRLGLALATAPYFQRTVVTPFKKLTGGDGAAPN